ncbi:hypothetical protein N1031_07005 [Herbiconiux moechotypicola]|uniref:Deoxynucleoside monophosphate kinase n=1 Tax=Herbiconiux moechotypicola TaxID=637393 RepID=A0ABN3DG92_9MICO|nr:hypothetical protein [Herbiconiux moechotypicola]MCS5729505.1 hypothetical protein [Herbiconiux moechotypicola]
MTAPALIGLIGKKRSGKDTFADALVAEGGFVKIAFADPLKEAALALDPIVGRPAIPAPEGGILTPGHDVRLSEVIDALGWERAKDYVPEVRRTLQRLGTEAIRALDDGFWIRAAMRRVDATRSLLRLRLNTSDSREATRPRPVVVTDCRFPNEADAIRERGGQIIRVTRPGVESTDPHPSEVALDSYAEDYHVLNDGTIADLHERARPWLGNP